MSTAQPGALGPLVEWALLALLLPLWLLAGWADSACHRRLRIEHTTGLHESRLHLLLIAELAVGVAAALLLQVTAATLLIMLASCLAHEATVWRDIAWADARRHIPWHEQWVHGVQQALPWVGLAALALVHREQTLALLGLGTAAPDWGLRWRVPAVPWPALAVVGLLGSGLVLWPFLAEYRRCQRAAEAARGAPPHVGLATMSQNTPTKATKAGTPSATHQRRYMK